MPITFDTLLARLPIVAENIIAEAAQHPGKFVDAGRYRVDCLRRKNQAKAALEGRRTLLAIKFRKNAALRGGDRVTDKAINEKVEVQPSVIKLKEAFDRADEQETLAQAVFSAYFARQSSIRVIADQQNLEGIRGSREVDRAEDSRKLRRRAEEVYEKRERRKHGVAQEDFEA